MILCLHNRIMVASSPLEAVCFPAIGFFSQIYSIRRVFLPEEQTVKPIRKQLATSVKLVPLSHPGHIVPGWSLLQGSQLAKIVGDFFLPPAA